MMRLAFVVGVACAASRAAAAPAPIIGGTASTAAVDASVVHLDIAGSPVGCTATAVASNVVLTAAHCVEDLGASDVTIDVGATAPFTATIAATDIWIARGYQGGADDVALIRTATALPVPAIALATVAPTVGEALHIVGFGETTAGNAQTVGTRYALAATIASFDTWFVVGGVAGATTCAGDSGGPWMSAASLATTPVIVAITSSGPDLCDGPAQAQRVDDPSLRLAEVIAAWSGPCAADGVCTTTGCGAIPDPDCGNCGFDGSCNPNCTVVDLDCPVGPAPGALCTTDLDCEDRDCIVAPDDATIHFCSRACDAADASSVCPTYMPTCSNDVCVYDGRTPGSLGTACTMASDCHSELCDAGAGICATPCTANGSCPAGYSCEPVGSSRACTIPTGGCASDSSSENQLLVSTLLLLGLLALRKRA